MTPSNRWLATHGRSIADALNAHQEPICKAVSRRLASTCPSLCFDPSRPDARSFQREMFEKTPVRLHVQLQAALRFRDLDLLEREYAWLWVLAPRYGVTRQHLFALVRWYFGTARTTLALAADDAAALDAFELAVIQIIERVTAAQNGAARPAPPTKRNGYQPSA